MSEPKIGVLTPIQENDPGQMTRYKYILGELNHRVNTLRAKNHKLWKRCNDLRDKNQKLQSHILADFEKRVTALEEKK